VSTHGHRYKKMYSLHEITLPAFRIHTLCKQCRLLLFRRLLNLHKVNVNRQRKEKQLKGNKWRILHTYAGEHVKKNAAEPQAPVTSSTSSESTAAVSTVWSSKLASNARKTQHTKNEHTTCNTSTPAGKFCSVVTITEQ
jgi:hypothetical protein